MKNKFSKAKSSGLLVCVLKTPVGTWKVVGGTRSSGGREILAYLPASTKKKAVKLANDLLKLYPNSKIIQIDGV